MTLILTLLLRTPSTMHCRPLRIQGGRGMSSTQKINGRLPSVGGLQQRAEDQTVGFGIVPELLLPFEGEEDNLFRNENSDSTGESLTNTLSDASQYNNYDVSQSLDPQSSPLFAFQSSPLFEVPFSTLTSEEPSPVVSTQSSPLLTTQPSPFEYQQPSPFDNQVTPTTEEPSVLNSFLHKVFLQKAKAAKERRMKRMAILRMKRMSGQISFDSSLRYEKKKRR